MRNILDIYKEYKIMPNLQLHQLRVAAVASMICDNFSDPLPKEDIVSAALLHDMGNILKFHQFIPEFVVPEGLEYWSNVREEYRKKYGDNEHEASLKIAKELGMSDTVIGLIKAVSFTGAPHTAAQMDFGAKIVEYGDSRVTPFGIVALEERIQDLRNRYGHKGGDTPERRSYEDAVRLIEKQIFAKCTLTPDGITDATAAPIIAALKSFVVK